LLSSVPGVSITGLRIDGVAHEFSTIEGVKEDVAEILLNLKQVALKPVITEFPHTVRAEIERCGEVLAGDLFTDGSLEVLNRHLHICTLTVKRTLKLELDITRGYGYVPLEKMRLVKKQAPAGTINLDGIYTPVRKVTFHVENTRVGQSVDYEKLILEVWTTGAVSPVESVSVATRLINQHFTLINEHQTVGEKKQEKDEEQKRAPVADPLETPVTELKLSTRIENALLARNIKTLGDLIKTPRKEFQEIRNLGKKSLEEIEAAVSARGYHLQTREETDKDSGENDETQKKNS
ncbi:MAG TPA: DNA-directed RNA polymerase subunit alpha, partial [bacterium]|nr:DNA-directed RNA polymerase subunit alpha [bacterium]